MAKNGLYVIVIFMLLLSSAKSQIEIENKTLDSLIRLAVENNPDILSNRFAQQSTEFKAKAAGTIPDPKLTIAALNLPRTSLSLGETPMSGIAIGLSQAVPWPGRLKAKKAIAQLKSDAKAQNVLAKENNIIRMLKYSYYDYSYWSFAKQVLDSNLILIQFLIDISETKYANGIGTAQDVLRAQTAKSRLENKLLSISQMRESSLIQIGTLIDDPSIINSELKAHLPGKLEPITINENLRNPHLAMAELQTSIGHKKLALARAGYYPNITFGIDYRIREDIPMDAIHGEDFLTAKVGLQLPLWFFAKQKNETKSARLTVKAAEENHRSVQRQLEQQIPTVKLALETIIKSVNQYDQSIIPQAIAAYEAAKVAYEVGEIDFNAILSAQMDLFEIELERLELIKSYWQKQAVLSELLGKK